MTTREELLAVAKPILFNTEMVRAILAGKKTQTRRVVKIKGWDVRALPMWASNQVLDNSRVPGVPFGVSNGDKGTVQYAYPMCLPGDILYLRETWAKPSARFLYAANYGDHEHFYRGNGAAVNIKWHPSIHMPKEAARIFLRVTDVRVERLRDITDEDARAEGAPVCRCEYTDYKSQSSCDRCKKRMTPRQTFAEIWDGTIKQKNRDTFGWRANPWVWVYTFEGITPDEEETS